MTRSLHDGRQDGLQPLQSLDIRSAEGLGRPAGADVADRLRRPRTGRSLPCAPRHDRRPAMYPRGHRLRGHDGGQMGRVLCEMIDAGMAQIIVCTGAVMAHGLSEAIGCTHYKHDPAESDKQLYEWGYNRVYDTLEMEANFWRAQELVSEMLEGFDWSQPACSSRINREMGRKLVGEGANAQHPGLRLSCATCRFTCQPSPIRNWAWTWRPIASLKGYTTGDEADLEKFFSRRRRSIRSSTCAITPAASSRPKRLGIFTVGGGVPRNWAQQVGPFSEIINMRLGAKLPVPRFRYGVRICPEPVHWGGLSGCTYSEGVSWGKFLSARGRRPFRRSALRRHHRLAAAGEARCWKCGRERGRNLPRVTSATSMVGDDLFVGRFNVKDSTRGFQCVTLLH